MEHVVRQQETPETCYLNVPTLHSWHRLDLIRRCETCHPLHVTRTLCKRRRRLRMRWRKELCVILVPDRTAVDSIDA